MDETEVRRIYREKYGERIAAALAMNCYSCSIDEADLDLVRAFCKVDNAFVVEDSGSGHSLRWVGAR